MKFHRILLPSLFYLFIFFFCLATPSSDLINAAPFRGSSPFKMKALPIHLKAIKGKIQKMPSHKSRRGNKKKKATSQIELLGKAPGIKSQAFPDRWQAGARSKMGGAQGFALLQIQKQ